MKKGVKKIINFLLNLHNTNVANTKHKSENNIVNCGKI